MKGFFHNNGLKILLAAVFILFGLMLYTASTPGSPLGSLLGLATAPMQNMSTDVANNANDAAAPVLRSNQEILAENEALKKENEELQTKLKNYNKYQLENAQLRKFLELKNNNPDFKPVPAAVIGRDPSDVFGGFTVDKGSLDGVKVDDPVMTEAGLVGKVSEVFATNARVITILSPDNNVSALDSVNRDSGVISCDLRLADQNLLKLGYLTAETQVQVGDLIETSGIGGVYPAGLKIGEVTALKNAEYDVSLYAEVRPYVDVKSVRDVMIITYFNGQGQALNTPTPSSAGAGD